MERECVISGSQEEILRSVPGFGGGAGNAEVLSPAATAAAYLPDDSLDSQPVVHPAVFSSPPDTQDEDEGIDDEVMLNTQEYIQSPIAMAGRDAAATPESQRTGRSFNGAFESDRSQSPCTQPWSGRRGSLSAEVPGAGENAGASPGFDVGGRRSSSRKGREDRRKVSESLDFSQAVNGKDRTLEAGKEPTPGERGLEELKELTQDGRALEEAKERTEERRDLEETREETHERRAFQEKEFTPPPPPLENVGDDHPSPAPSRVENDHQEAGTVTPSAPPGGQETLIERVLSNPRSVPARDLIVAVASSSGGKKTSCYKPDDEANFVSPNSELVTMRKRRRRILVRSSSSSPQRSDHQPPERNKEARPGAPGKLEAVLSSWMMKPSREVKDFGVAEFSAALQRVGYRLPPFTT